MSTILALSGVTSSGWVSLAFNSSTDDLDAIRNLHFLSQVKKEPLYQVYRFLNNNGKYVVTGIGLPCNLLSFLVLRRIKPVTSAILIMLILAVVDSLRLIQGAIENSLINKCYRALIREPIKMYSVWLVVLLTLERVIAVCFSLKATRICTISNAIRSAIFMFIFNVIVSIPKMFRCFIKGNINMALLLLSIRDYSDPTFYVIIPLVFLCLGNAAIIGKLIAPREINSLTDGSTSSHVNRRQNRSITLMLLAVCITTIVFLAPYSISKITAYGWLVSTDDFNSREYALELLFTQVFRVVPYINNAINFFLYILSGSRFRRELREMIASWVGS